MDYDRFRCVVQEFAHVDREGAERASRAVLETLAERVAPGEACDLMAQCLRR
jgi:uncharacterized protein (DUF2267 family)